MPFMPPLALSPACPPVAIIRLGSISGDTPGSLPPVVGQLADARNACLPAPAASAAVSEQQRRIDPRHEAELFAAVRSQMERLGNVARFPQLEWEQAPLIISRCVISREQAQRYVATHVHVGDTRMVPPKIGEHNGGMRCLIHTWEAPGAADNDPTLTAQSARDRFDWFAHNAIGAPRGQVGNPHALRLTDDLCAALDATTATGIWRGLPDAARARLVSLLRDACDAEAHAHGLIATRAAVVPHASTPFLEGDPGEYFLAVTCVGAGSPTDVVRHIPLGRQASDIVAQIQRLARAAAGQGH